MKIKSKSIHIHAYDPTIIEQELDSQLEGIEDYQVVTITESRDGRQFHYTVFYKQSEIPKPMTPFEIWERQRQNQYTSTGEYIGND